MGSYQLNISDVYLKQMDGVVLWITWHCLQSFTCLNLWTTEYNWTWQDLLMLLVKVNEFWDWSAAIKSQVLVSDKGNMKQ